ncbi:MAG: hypothetical protein J6X18_09385 [Bacteroidales bacterium]|nr:hypothetical protein [Bacteroidales bacterium]
MNTKKYFSGLVIIALLSFVAISCQPEQGSKYFYKRHIKVKNSTDNDIDVYLSRNVSYTGPFTTKDHYNCKAYTSTNLYYLETKYIEEKMLMLNFLYQFDTVKICKNGTQIRRWTSPVAYMDKDSCDFFNFNYWRSYLIGKGEIEWDFEITPSFTAK